MKLFGRLRKKQNIDGADLTVEQLNAGLRDEPRLSGDTQRFDFSAPTPAPEPALQEGDFWDMLADLKAELGEEPSAEAKPAPAGLPEKPPAPRTEQEPDRAQIEQTQTFTPVSDDDLEDDPLALLQTQVSPRPPVEAQAKETGALPKPGRAKRPSLRQKAPIAPARPGVVRPDKQTAAVPPQTPPPAEPQTPPPAEPQTQPPAEAQVKETGALPKPGRAKGPSLRQKDPGAPALPGVVRPGKQTAAVPPVPAPPAEPLLPEQPQSAEPQEPPAPAETAPQKAPPKPKKKPAEAPVLKPEDACRKYSVGYTLLHGCLIGASILAAITVLLSVYLDYEWGFLADYISEGWLRAILVILCLIQLGLGWPLWRDGLEELKQGRFPMELLLLIAAVFSVVDGVRALYDGRTPLCGVPILLLAVALWGSYDGRTALLTVTKLLRGVQTPVGVNEVPGPGKGKRSLTRGKGSVEKFMRHLTEPSPFDRFRKVYAPVMGALILFGSVVISALTEARFAWTATLLFTAVLSPAALLSDRRLLHLLSKRLTRAKAAVCGWYGAKVFSGSHAILITDSDLFPEKQIQLNGIKLYTGDIDRVIGYATATAEATNSTLLPLFDELRENRNGRRFRVDRFRYYENGGVGAEIQGDVVLMGTMEFMKRMGVHMEGSVRVRQAVYTSINGVLAAVFAIRYQPTDSVRRGLSAAAGNRHFKLILATRDSLLTPDFLAEVYGVPSGNMIYPDIKERLRLAEQERREDGEQGAILAENAFGSFAEAAAGGRTLRSAGMLSIWLSLLYTAVTLALMGAMAWLGAVETANAANYLLYLLVWLLPTWLLSGWTRRS